MSRCMGTVLGHEDEVLDVALDNQGSRLASASSDATARLWDITGEFKEIAVLEGHQEEVSKSTCTLIHQKPIIVQLFPPD